MLDIFKENVCPQKGLLTTIGADPKGSQIVVEKDQQVGKKKFFPKKKFQKKKKIREKFIFALMTPLQIILEFLGKRDLEKFQ